MHTKFTMHFMTRKKNQSGQAYLQSGLMRSSSRSWSMTSSYLDRQKSTWTYSETLIMPLWLHQSGRLVRFLCMDRRVSQERKNMISVVLMGGRKLPASCRCRRRHLAITTAALSTPPPPPPPSGYCSRCCQHAIAAAAALPSGCRRRRATKLASTATALTPTPPPPPCCKHLHLTNAAAVLTPPPR